MTKYWISLLAFCPAALAQTASFQGIGHLPGQHVSAATAVSADGNIVVGSASSETGTAAIRWSPTMGIEALESAPGFGAPSWKWSASAASNDGSVIVGFADAGLGGWLRSDFAFRWTATTGMVDLGHVPGATHSGALDVSGDGSIVVGYSGPINGPYGTSFRWTQSGGMQEFLSQSFGFARAISSDGTAITGNHAVQGYRWTAEGGMQLVSEMPENSPAGISGDGAVIVGSQYTMGYPYRWTAGTGLQSLGMVPGAWRAGASAVSDDGSIVVGGSYDDLDTHAFIWDEVGGIRHLRDVLESTYGLNLTGWRLSRATGISADGGVVVGTGINPAGQQEGWVARLGVTECYANCDNSTTAPILNVDDFTCFINSFAAAQALPHEEQVTHYANCDQSTAPPVLNVDDFTCFIDAFAAGCP